MSTITTNGHARPLLSWAELTPKQREWVDYLEYSDEHEEAYSPQFFTYRGNVYDIGEFMHTEESGDLHAQGWHGIFAESAFSGVIVKLTEVDYDTCVIVGYVVD